MFSFIMYADDTTISSTLKPAKVIKYTYRVFHTYKNFSDSTLYNNKSTESSINGELRNIIEWLNINKLSLIKDKSKYMIFHVPKKDTLTLTLKIDNINIERVDEFNFLG